MIRKQYTLYMENRPGAIAKITKALSDNKVNIEGLSLSVTADVGLLQLIVSNATVATKIFKKFKVPYTSQEVALVPLTNKPGTLARMASKLAKAGVNINYIYGTGGRKTKDGDFYVVVSASNLKKVEKALG